MITDIDLRSTNGPDLRRTKLKEYWNEYFAYEREAPELHGITEAALNGELDRARTMPRPFLDAQQAISRILTELGSRHNFHRQFNEAFPNFKPSQILGMQLYALVLRDATYWVYHPTQHSGHLFPHATYFIPAGEARYECLAGQNGV
jgi:hypothetical protein